jgi:hypothetical protein
VRTRLALAACGPALSLVLALAPTPAAATVRLAPVGRDVTATPAGELTSTTLRLTAPIARSDGPAPTADAGWVGAADVEPGTQMVGLTWIGDDTAEVEVRAESPDGSWSTWTDVHGHHGAPAPGEGVGRAGGDPVWLGSDGTERVEVRVASGEVTDLRLDAMRWEAAGSPRALVADRPATSAGGPTIYARASWAPAGWQGWREGCSPQPQVMSQLRFSVVHHTAGTNTYSSSDVPGILAGMYRFHTDGQGWCDIAYNLFVDRFGRAWQGRSGSLHDPIQGGHAKGFNTHSVGIALLGQHHPGGTPAAVSPTSAALTTLRDLLAWKLSAHNANPRATIDIVSLGSPRYPEGQRVRLPVIQGHRDSGLTSCPGDLTYSRLAGLRDAVAARIAATDRPWEWAPFTTGPGFFGRLQNDAAGRGVPNGIVGTHTSLVLRGGWPRDALATSIVLSARTDDRIGSVDRLYRAAFRRSPDDAGLHHWVAQRDAGMPVIGVARRFALSTEFRRTYDPLADPQFVDRLYRNVLGRAPDQSGMSFWLARMSAGMTRHHVLASMSESAEHRARVRVDGTVTRGYFVTLDRVPSVEERRTWAIHLLQGGSGQDLVTLLVHSSEYARRVT